MVNNTDVIEKIEAEMKINVLFAELDLKIFKCKEEMGSNYYIHIEENKHYFYKLSRIIDLIEDTLRNKSKTLSTFYVKVTGDYKPAEVKEWITKIIKSVPVINNIGYRPSSETIFIDNDNRVLYNTYRLPDIRKSPSIIKDNYSFPHIQKLLMFLCNDSEESYSWMNKRIAHALTKPTDRVPTAIILQGAQGSGKNTFTDFILRPLFQYNTKIITQRDIDMNFDSHYMFQTQLVIANEVINVENKFTLPNKLKTYISEDSIMINPKGRDARQVENYTFFVFTTNEISPIKLDKDNRRYTVITRFEPIEVSFIKELKANLETELIEYYNYLLSLEYDTSDIYMRLATEGEKDAITVSSNSVELFIANALESDSFFKAHEGICKEFYQSSSLEVSEHLEPFKKKDGIYVIIKDLYESYKKFCTNEDLKPCTRHIFTRLFKKAGYQTKKIRQGEETYRAILIKRIKTEGL
jgi:phage/plasmid-associated DNA primase